MHDFGYHRPASAADAAGLIASKSDGKIVAGGMTLIPTLKQRLAQPSDLITICLETPPTDGSTRVADTRLLAAVIDPTWTTTIGK